MSATKIERVRAREVFDSRGRPTVEVDVHCGRGFGRAIVPSGASTGRFEAIELRDGDVSRLDGDGVRTAVANVIEHLGPAVTGLDADAQEQVDARLREVDGTPNGSRLGANAILGVSLAAARAAADARSLALVDHLQNVWRRYPSQVGDLPAWTAGLGEAPLLPVPMVNVVSGGLHAGGNLDIQDVLAIPLGVDTYRAALDRVITVFRGVGRKLRARGLEGRLVADEGGYGPKLASNEEALALVVDCARELGLEPGRDVAIALDVASTHFFADGTYRFDGSDLAPDAMADVLAGWVERYPVVSIEDGLAEDDWAGWKSLTDRLGDRVQLLGDDLFVTSPERLRRGIDAGAGNSVLVKPNQIGTLTDTFRTMRLAIDHGYRPVVSARSGETEDSTIADLAVATGAGQIKIGSVTRSERLAKYNQLLRLEESLEDRADYAGRTVLRDFVGSR